MIQPRYEPVGEDIWCIDTGLYRPELAACYLIRGGGRLACIDTGTAHTVPLILEVMAELGHGPEDLDYVIPTHVHLDHAGGAGQLMQACPQATLAIHPKGAPHLIDPTRLIAGATAVYGEVGFAAAYDTLEPVPAERVLELKNGATLDLGGRTLTFIDTPGHANHHGCIYDAVTQAWFTGDTFGIAYRELYAPQGWGSPPRGREPEGDGEAGPYLFAPTTPVAFDPDAWQASLDRLMAVAPQAMYLTHYGRLDDPAGLVETLRRSIRDQAAMALEVAAAGPEGRLDRLKVAVAARLVEGARTHGCILSDEQLREVLAVDMDLNAQGLEVWLVRRERRGT